MRRVLLFVLALLAMLPLAPAHAATPSSFTKHAGPGRDYWLFTPAGSKGAARPLLVYLHGCTQTGDDAAIGTRWNDFAAAHGIVVVYPEQSADANGTQCWNWFEPDHQSRDAGEPSIIVAIVRAVEQSQRIDASRVYVAGASAGADMATILGATYPDVFAAIAPFAGCAYLTCTDVTGVMAKQAMGPRARQLPAMIVQGTGDMLNNVALGETAVQQWVGTNGLDPRPTAETHGDFTAVDPGAGDPCARSAHFPCAGGALGWTSYPYTVHHYGTATCDLVDAWYIHGLNHDYPSGRVEHSFTDPIGPDINAAAWTFFSHHRVGHPCARP